MNFKRMAKGIKLLRSLPAEPFTATKVDGQDFAFDMGSWGTPVDGGDNHVNHRYDTLPKEFCGTAGCAMGAFAMHSEFIKEGLLSPCSYHGALFFDIGYYEAKQLFVMGYSDNLHNISPHEVADKMEALFNQHAKCHTD